MEQEKVQIINKEEKPILTMKYMTGKVFWRLLFPYAFIMLLFSGTFILIFERIVINECNIKDCFGVLFFGLIMIIIIFSSLEILLMKNIKLYQDKIEKEWLFFGTKQLPFSNARIRGMQTWFISNKTFLYINKPRWYMFKCCSYDENLISEKDKEEAIKIVANISNRDINEFQKLQVDMNPLIKNKR